MKPGFVSYIRTLLTIIFLSWGVIPEVFASCNISGNGGNPAKSTDSPCLRWMLIAMPFLERLLRQ